MQKIIIFLFYFLFQCSVFAQYDSPDQKFKDLKDKIVGTAESAWDGAKSFWTGIRQSVGEPPSNFKYSYAVFNDAPARVVAIEQKLTAIMGANFSGDISKSYQVAPFNKLEVNNEQLYIAVWIIADKSLDVIKNYPRNDEQWKSHYEPMLAGFGKTPTGPISGDWFGGKVSGLFTGLLTTEKLEPYKIYEKDIYPWGPDDNNVYYYHVYTSRGDVKGEYLDIKASTTDFSGNFFNHSDTAASLSFMKDGASYKVTLEPQSFSYLQSTAGVTNSIRPGSGDKRFFIFSAGGAHIGYIPIPEQGIANVSYDEQKKKFFPADPMTYTYEVYKEGETLSVSLQGLSVGNFDQPVNNPVRDINPLPCHIWYRSAAQSKELAEKAAKEQNVPDDTSSLFFDAPETFWIVYKTKDQTIYEKIQPGVIKDIMILRPQNVEKAAWLYGVVLNSSDENKAKLFLDRLADGKIGAGSIKTNVTETLDLSAIEPNINGFINDKVTGGSGLQGYVLLADQFLPSGVGVDHFYYYIDAPELRIDQLLSNIYLDDSYYTKDSSGNLTLNDTAIKELTSLFPKWITDYRANKNDVEQQLKKYLLQKGSKILFTDPNATEKTFSNFGNQVIQMLLKGPISIENFPLLRKAGVNYYVYALGEKPDDWPATK